MGLNCCLFLQVISIQQCRDEMILEFNIKDVYTKCIYCFVFVFFLFTRACCLFFSLSGHINQVKQNLSKTPQDLIPSVFINS